MKRLSPSQSIIRIFLIITFVFSFWTLLPTTSVRAATLIVDTLVDENDHSCSDGDCSLRDAIEVSNPSDIINFDQSLAGETITLSSSSLSITKDLTIDGSDLDPHITISGADSVHIFDITGTTSVTLKGLNIVNGSNTNGGALFMNASNLFIYDCLFEGNNATNNGGAIHSFGGYMFIQDSTFDTNSGNNGGAVYFAPSSSNVTFLDRVTFKNNSAVGGGGGLIVESDGTADVSNSTFYNNDASVGGGIYINGSAYLWNNTLSANSATPANGGGIYNNGTTNMRNTIIADSPTGGDCAYGLTPPSNDNNLIEDNTCSPTVSGDPILLPLANNGGTTETMALGSGSPAIDAGNESSCKTEDQRGVDRPHGSVCDIGAYEAADGVNVNSTDDPGNGTCDDSECTLREAIQVAAAEDSIYFDENLSGVTISLASTLDISKDISIVGSFLIHHPVLDGGNSLQIMDIAEDAVATIFDLDFQNGSAMFGGAIQNQGTLHLYEVEMSGNHASAYGGAIYNTGAINLRYVNFNNNSSDDDGGALYQANSTSMYYIYYSTFENNNSLNDGGAIYVSTPASLNVEISTFYNNAGNGNGGGIYNAGSLHLNNVTLSTNHATGGSGGGIYNDSGATLSIINSIISDTPPGDGGDCVDNGSITTNTNNLIEDNSCGSALSGDPNLGPLTHNGGYTKTIALNPGSPAIDAGNDLTCSSLDQRKVDRPHGAQCDIGAYESAASLEVNSSIHLGDGICDDSECTLQEAVAVAASGDTVTFDPSLAGSTISLSNTQGIDKDLSLDGSGLSPQVEINGGDAVQAFIVLKDMTVSFSHLDITHGSAEIGGGIEIPENTAVTIDSCTFENNAADDGGAINNIGTLTITDSTFTSNSAVDYGGAINNNGGSVTISNSTFDGNTSDQFGGGLFNAGDTASMTITNSTLYDNAATSFGGGIENWRGTLTLSNSTLANNTAGSGGAGLVNAGTGAILHLKNTIVSDSNTTEDCVNGETISTNTNNLIEDGTCSPAISGDPGLAALADNGGPTETMSITESSPAFDAGDNTSCETVDQRGITRPQGDHCDIGAFELALPEINLTGNGQSISDGDISPTPADHTDFGNVYLGLSPVTRTFTIANSGGEVLNLTDSPNYVQISGTHAADFTVTAQPTSPVAASGGTTTFTVSFNPSIAGTRLATVSIANNDIDENPYTFSIQGAGSDGTFSDVTSAHWAFQYVEAIADAGLTSGYPDGTYRPENPVTRAEMAVFLLNGMGVSAPAIDGSHPFSDIAGHWAEAYIEELYDQGITGGYPDGTYRPENLVTRAEMAVFLLKGIGVTPPALDGSHPFTDVAGHWAEIFIEELYDQGITGGYPDGTYRPENRVTRAEMAVFLVNTFNIPLP